MEREGKRINFQGGRTALEVVLLAAAAALILTGCISIWNAGDLAVWVKDRAVKEGCLRETIELEEWYSQTEDGNVWRGTCRDNQNDPMSFGINVDSVWKPSAELPEHPPVRE